MIRKRRTEDDEDDVVLFIALPHPPPQAEEVDDFGRSIQGSTFGVQSGPRRARRGIRAQRRASRPQSSVEDEGFSTDSSLPPSDAADFEMAMRSLNERIGTLLSDVKAEDFKDPNLAINKKFMEWRDMYPDSYQNAWGSLGVVSSWEFWTRVELVGWDPLHVRFIIFGI